MPVVHTTAAAVLEGVSAVGFFSADGIVSADGAVDQRGLGTTMEVQTTAIPGGRVATDVAVGQRGRAVVVFQSAAVVGGVVAEVATIQCERAVIVHAAAVDGGVVADGAVGQRGRAAGAAVHAAAVTGHAAANVGGV